MNFITTSDLELKFGSAWDTQENFELYADQINSWLLGKGVGSIPLDATSTASIKMAAFFLARAAKEDALYVDSNNIKSIKASAQTGTFAEQTFFATAQVKNRWIKIAEDILNPLLYEATGQVVFIIHKII